jgi:tripartite-type tricarboxylate transporter receptor subunit TctC
MFDFSIMDMRDHNRPHPTYRVTSQGERTVIIRRLFRHLLATMAVALGCSAWASDYPAAGRSITIYLGFPAGGGMDAAARALQEPLKEALKANVLIDYKPGAAGNIASQFVAQARPDGYTLLVGTAATHGANAALYSKLPFDVEADFTPVSMILDAPNVLVVNPAVIDVKTVSEFVQQVKASPGKHSYASTGSGTSTHLAFADLAARTGMQVQHIPFKGGADAMMALLRGDVCCIFSQAQVVLGHLGSGKLRALGVSTTGRLPLLPDVPTIAEAGVAGYENSLWFGLFGPKGMDPVVVDKLNQALKRVLEMPAVRQRLTELGNTARHETPEQFRATVRRDRSKWTDLVKTTGARVE